MPYLSTGYNDKKKLSSAVVMAQLRRKRQGTAHQTRHSLPYCVSDAWKMIGLPCFFRDRFSQHYMDITTVQGGLQLLNADGSDGTLIANAIITVSVDDGD